MSNPQNNPPTEPAAKAMTVAQAAAKVRRIVSETVDGATREKRLAVAANEVLDFKDYGSHVVVVTKDGQKFSSAATATAD